MDKRYQVFISSTYTDLKDERQKVIQTLMEMDCIPAGMEIFPAADEEQFEFIKRIIDDCDYYLVIVGGRYGSLTQEGISYTEKEYDYAVHKDLKIIALLHEDPDSIPLGKSEKEPELREKLNSFKEKLSTGRLVRFWKTETDLPGLVSLSLSKTIKMHPAVGWVRGDKAANEQVLSEINELRKNNEQLNTEVSKYKNSFNTSIEDIADLDEKYTIAGEYYYGSGSNLHDWEIKVSWDKIFSLLAPKLQQPLSDSVVKDYLARQLYALTNKSGRTPSIDEQNFLTIKIQLEALGLIQTRYSPTTNKSMALFWILTDLGRRKMVELRVIRTKKR